MWTTEQLSVALPHDMPAQVRARVAPGRYASETEVIRDGLRAFQAQGRPVEQWLRSSGHPCL